MKTIPIREWKKLYAAWRKPYAHLPQEMRIRIIRGCVGKGMYESKEEGESVAAHLPPRKGLWVSVYPCDICKHWHIGNTNGMLGVPNGLRGEEQAA